VFDRLVFSQSLLSLDLIEDFLALKTDEAEKHNSTSNRVIVRKKMESFATVGWWCFWFQQDDKFH